MADNFSMSRRARSRTSSFDRFIPNRSAMDIEFAQFQLTKSSSPKERDLHPNSRSPNDSGIWSPDTSPSSDEGSQVEDEVEGLRQNIEGNLSITRRRLAFSTDVSEKTGNSRLLQFRPRTKSADSHGSTVGERYAVLAKLGRKSLPEAAAVPRRELESLERVVALPQHTQNFLHHNLGHSHDRVAFGFGPEVYLWNVTLPASHACGFTGSTSGADVSSVSLNQTGDRIAIGRESDQDNVEILDVESQRQLIKMTMESQVYDFAWTKNEIAFGRSEGVVALYDLREGTSKERAVFKTDGDLPLSIEFSPNFESLVTGDAEGMVALWERRMPLKGVMWKLLVQQGPVTRLAWCPWHSYSLACSGIESDEVGKIRVLNILTGLRKQSKDIPAGVTGLGWYQKEQELVTSQIGMYKSVVFWDPTSMKQNHALPDNQQVTDMIVMNDNRIVFTTMESEMKVWKLTSDSNPQRRRRANTFNHDTLRKSIFRMNTIR